MAAAKRNYELTLRDVAKKAGVSLATASRAMRDDPSTKETTRAKVKEVAEKMGYRPDPGMAHLISRRWQGKRHKRGMNVAYLYCGNNEAGEICRTQYQNFKGIADNLGYALLDVDLCSFSAEPKVLQRLWVQGVEGVLMGVLPEVPYDLDGVCKKYPVVSMNVSRYRPQCPIIMHDEFTAISQVWEKLHEMGYRRIGVILPDYPDSISTDLRLGAILARRSLEKPKKNSIPILYHDAHSSQFGKMFEPWLKKHQPDVVIGYDDTISEQIQRLGVRLPEDFAYATYNLWQKKAIGTVAGYYRNNDEICTTGLQLLNMMVRTSRMGAHNAGMVEMIAGEWKDGKTLPLKS